MAEYNKEDFLLCLFECGPHVEGGGGRDACVARVTSGWRESDEFRVYWRKVHHWYAANILHIPHSNSLPEWFQYWNTYREWIQVQQHG